MIPFRLPNGGGVMTADDEVRAAIQEGKDRRDRQLADLTAAESIGLELADGFDWVAPTRWTLRVKVRAEKLAKLAEELQDLIRNPQ